MRPEAVELADLVRQKVAVPGNDPVDVGRARLSALRAQSETQLKSVLRQHDYDAFDLDRAFDIVAGMAQRVG